MTVLQILRGLERSTATGAQAETDARLGFLEWLIGLEGAASAAEARAALAIAAAHRPQSAAARAFVGCLRQASRPIAGHARRRRAQLVH